VLFKQIVNRKNATLLAFTGLFFGLFYSRVVLSNAMILLAVVALLNRDFFQHFKAFLKRKDLLIISGVFLLYALSGINSEDQGEFLTRLRVKIPYAFLPLTFITLPFIEKKYLNAVVALFVLFTFSGMAYPLYSYLSDPELYNQVYRQGHVLPTPINHIRFSILLSIAHFIALWLSRNWYLSKRYFLSFSLLLIALLIFIFLHVLAVRSGLLGLYLAWFALVIIWFRKKWKYQLLAITLMFVSGFIALKVSPTLDAKWNYMKYDLEGMIADKEHTGFSDSGRIISMMAGLEAGSKKILFGHGIGDINAAMAEIYSEKYPYILQTRNLKPHNQFVFVFVGIGLIGLLYLIASLLLPIFHQRNYRIFLFIIIQIILLSSLLTESTLEGQIGVATYLFFTLFFIQYKDAFQQN
jgi:O-antigen ligase